LNNLVLLSAHYTVTSTIKQSPDDDDHGAGIHFKHETTMNSS